MIRFGEDVKYGYQSRTRLNVVMSDITIAFAIDDTTYGEKATKKFAEDSATPFFMIHINERGKISSSEKDTLNQCFEKMKQLISKNLRGVILNVAGNGMYTFSKYGISQSRLDEMIYNILLRFKEKGIIFYCVRSGGQTGIDEAALKAADKLGLPTICLAPKGWKFRTASGEDIEDELLFKQRFA